MHKKSAVPFIRANNFIVAASTQAARKRKRPGALPGL
jgi:hypothetical protein